MLEPGLSDWSVGFPRKAHRAQLEPAVCYWLQVYGSSKGGSCGRGRLGVGWDTLSIRSSSENVAIRPRWCHWDLSSRRQPISQEEFCGPAEESRSVKHLDIPELHTFMKRLCSCYLSRKPQSLWVPPPNPRPVTMRRNFTPGAQPRTGKWDLAQRLCRSMTAGGQNGGMNCKPLVFIGPPQTPGWFYGHKTLMSVWLVISDL